MLSQPEPLGHNGIVQSPSCVPRRGASNEFPHRAIRPNFGLIWFLKQRGVNMSLPLQNVSLSKQL